MRRVDRLDLAQMLGAKIVEPRDAEKPHSDDDLLLEDLERLHEPGFATSGERPALQAPDAHSFRAERDGLQHVGAPINAAVDDDLGAARDRVDDLGKRVERPRAQSSCRPPWLDT